MVKRWTMQKVEQGETLLCFMENQVVTVEEWVEICIGHFELSLQH